MNAAAGGEPAWLRREGADLCLCVRLTPKAAADRIEAPAVLADGRAVLKVRVRAVPEDGKANAALVALIAGAAKVAASRVRLVSGAASRVKTLRIEAAGDMEFAALRQAAENNTHRTRGNA
ncbi:MAG: DUF167 domain-containing protein [Flavobacteriaceae bacterium]